MNIENIPKPDAALVAAVSNVNERALKLSDLLERGDTQESVIADLARQLDELVTARKWESANSPEDATIAKSACASLTAKLEEERELFLNNKWPVRFLAMRFAAKEATVKAMGTGFRHGMWIRDVGVINNEWGQPLVIYSERGQGVCDSLGIGTSHVSLTDDAGLIIAFAVVEKT